MLEIRPTCENCGAQLLPNSIEAMICSFECTFCRKCVEEILDNVCPNCGGGFTARPIRPARRWRGENCFTAVPASANVVSKNRSTLRHINPLTRLPLVSTIPPDQR